ncbi:MAG: molybdopterin-dependent oxidoreductase [Dehalococcoidia bacterium]|jgi:DMSO/TMAO reductase YedYZ molybdopterin-dependent catalytic subunit
MTSENKNSRFFKTLLILALSTAAVLQGCAGSLNPEKARELEAAEIKEYQGEKLGSITDFNENSIKGPQYVDISAYRLKITGLVNKPMSYTYDDVISKHQAYTKLLTINCVEGWSVKILWEGLQLKDLLDEANVKPEAKVVIFHAYDGYTTSLPLQYIFDKNLLLAYKMNGIILPPERGYPFELVAEDKWGYKWIKWVNEIELSDNTNYTGYWESEGYSNDGSLDKSFFNR